MIQSEGESKMIRNTIQAIVLLLFSIAANAEPQVLPLPHYRAVDRPVSLYCGDFFRFSEQSFDAHYDRGALVALPADLRLQYARHTSSLLSRDAAQLVITVEYDQDVCDGPPYSIEPDEAKGHWPRLRRHASVDDTKNAPPKFLKAGLERMDEVVWIAEGT